MTNEERFKAIFQDQVNRPGADDLLEWLESAGFFTAPASTKYHGEYPGGLVEHSLRVYDFMISSPYAASGCVGAYTGRKRKKVGIECTAAERIEIEFCFDFYKFAFEKELERFYIAFLQKNRIFPDNPIDDAREIGEMSLEEAQRISMMMAGMDEHTRRKMLESGAGT